MPRRTRPGRMTSPCGRPKRKPDPTARNSSSRQVNEFRRPSSPIGMKSCANGTNGCSSPAPSILQSVRSRAMRTSIWPARSVFVRSKAGSRVGRRHTHTAATATKAADTDERDHRHAETLLRLFRHLRSFPPPRSFPAADGFGTLTTADHAPELSAKLSSFAASMSSPSAAALIDAPFPMTNGWPDPTTPISA